ncbi:MULTISPECIES: non-ribosomal peptide synthetase [unclassified Tolypothrix]|uniref:non-ribosomal peptide synthetase n=1 Tax=unclassified Tolypothrix TaxID=2649714 RepID=UPI0005EAB86A|nr:MULTISPECIES: non-ribosomal peptide synthetase [unclassified Tolypothrix]BAY93738.1 amino acid adenylation domain-containing protein [Microchaete diplosiphon NIES-3275]EKF03257.1 AMP-binding enzyme [Tolypothrix sp. PCC 7601]MBE9082535.1 amino acid adenylation domain-containing protein [Tolypothrix sp. LEGE 11397]UYD27543.1 amino acid adenylation domain-containing protein [Tolypothrix sp. PCC 7712]UYD36595.1 amino acid adenylation domain-containing protein [Tolypothrix sp. PCC 7601]
MSQYILSSLTDDEELNFSQEAEVFVFPTSFAQQRLWFLDQLAPGNPFYNVSTALRLKGSLNFTALRQTFNEIVRRHEILRTRFVMVDQQPVQVIAPSLTISFPLIDLRNFKSQERETQVRRIATQEAKYPFNLTTGPLLRVKLLQLNEAEYVLLLNLHHIVADGWSIGVLIKELGVLYKAFADDEGCLIASPFAGRTGDASNNSLSTPLPELPIQYADFAQWQREWLQGVGANSTSPLQTQLAYWQKQLDGLSVLNLPTDRLRPAVPSYRGAKQFLELPQSLTQALEALSYQEGVTLFMTLLAAFQTLLYRYTQQEDIAVGSPIANRNRSELEGLIGFFVNSLVLRTDLSGNPTFRELLNRVREVTLGGYAHQDLPFEKLVEELHPERDLSHHPLFQVVFSLQNTPIEALELPGLKLSLFEFDSKTAKFDLEFHLWQDLETLKGQVVYSTDLFDQNTITRMVGHFQTLLESIVVNSKQRLSDLPLLTEGEQQQLLIDWNNTQKSYPHNKCFHQLFEAQVEQTPDAIVLVFGDEQLSYKQLNIRSNQVAHYLQKIGVEAESLVGICVERSLEMIIGLLGILKAGGAYLPLDTSLPQERLNFMLEDAQVSVVLTQEKLLKHFQEFSKPIICIDKDWTAITQNSQENPTNCVTFENLAYVIYTSGTTGKPKGVLIEHWGLSNLVEAQIETFNLQSSNRILQFASLSFDASIFEIAMALRTGATLYLANKESLLPGQPLLQLLREKAITHVILPPAVLAVLPTESLSTLQTIICAGESCTDDIVKRWWSSSRRFFNAYGPTEATVWSTVAEIKSVNEKPPIGRPINNIKIYILDNHLQPLPIGITGELYIDGDGLARGYLNHPELTAQKFIPNPFNQQNGARLYKTGDLARYRVDGNIEFLGRIDNQVKIRGFRIELSEIETVLSQHQNVQKAVVIAQENVSGDKYLIGYIVPNVKTQNIASLLRNFLKEKLPEYMVPKAFVMLDYIPLTANGKVDIYALTALDTPNYSRDEAFIAPRTPTESTLAKIWAEILNIEDVGIHDNFFDLGGNSLLTVHCLQQINKQFELELPLSTLFLNPTIESLATSLSSKTDFIPSSPLVSIQPTGSNPPFFCVHPIFGVVFPYYELAHHLGKNQPFYGLQSIGIDGETPLTRIEDMATHYIEALRSVQPKGPYFLGGWSFGGWVAFEMAQQLQKSGEEVALLAVLDTVAPIKDNIPSLSNSFKFLLTTVIRYIWPFFLDYLCLITAPGKNRINSLISRFPNFNQFVQLLQRNLFSHFILKEDATDNLISKESQLRLLSELAVPSILRVFYANSQAVLNYVPQVYPKQIHFFRTQVQSTIAEKEPSMGWNQLAAEGTEIHHIPGNHLTMLRKPHIQVLAAQIKASVVKLTREEWKSCNLDLVAK